MFVSVSAAVAGLLFGLDIGVIAGALPFITDHFTLSNRLQEWVVSSMMLGAAVGALFNGWLSFRLGRKYSLMVGAILFVAGSLGSAFATGLKLYCFLACCWAWPWGLRPTPRRFISRKWRAKTCAEK
ncbi:Arabinose transporter [Leclercia adecarboxylata]|uniref:Arabinose transporter n=1 Tax=Leclercia adecarboxylata TaxID=83655 RepID=A0A4U9ILU8_9ENTR|nr:Arabinose transporter [Leclercia adecarboxylata]